MTTCWSQAHRPRLLKLEGWWLRSQKHHPVTSPSTSQKKVLKLILWQFPQHCLKKPLSKSQWRVWVFWAWAASSPCLVPCNKCCMFLLHNLVLVDWLCCETVSRPELAVLVQSLSYVWLFVTPWTVARQASLPSLSPGTCSDSCPLNWCCHSTISSSVIPFFSCLQSLPASGSFTMSQLFESGGQSIGASASASVLPMNIQSWFPFGLTGLISYPNLVP